MKPGNRPVAPDGGNRHGANSCRAFLRDKGPPQLRVRLFPTGKGRFLYRASACKSG